jgi:hypothetical protein
MFLVRVEISDLPLHFPWESENWLMGAFEHADYDEKLLVCLNRVQCHQQAVLFQMYSMPVERQLTGDT